MKPRHKVPSRKQSGIDKRSKLEKFLTFFISSKRLSEMFGQSKNNSSGHNHQHGGSDNHIYSESTHRIAIILDGKIYDILTTQEELAEIFLAQPTFALVDVSCKVKPGDLASELKAQSE